MAFACLCAISHRCDSCRIQTCNLLIRSQMLYSVELRSQIYVVCQPFLWLSDCKGTTFQQICKGFPHFFLKTIVIRVFYKLVSMKGRASILLGCIRASRTVSFCFSSSHVARYVLSWKTKTYGTIAANPSQANL